VEESGRGRNGGGVGGRRREGKNIERERMNLELMAEREGNWGEIRRRRGEAERVREGGI